MNETQEDLIKSALSTALWVVGADVITALQNVTHRNTVAVLRQELPLWELLPLRIRDPKTGFGWYAIAEASRIREFVARTAQDPALCQELAAACEMYLAVSKKLLS